MNLTEYTVGVDLGQAHDYTAFAILEENELRRYDLRHIERHRGVSYPLLVDRLRQILSRLSGTPSVVVDATGCGRPVVDMVNDAGLKADIYAITITGGDTVTREGFNLRVPKRDLVSSVACLLQTGRLRIPRTLPDGDLLQRELLAFRAKISLTTGHDTYEAWREKDHDDLVLAVALACWLNEKGRDGWLMLVRQWEEKQGRLSPHAAAIEEFEKAESAFRAKGQQDRTAPAPLVTRVVCPCGRAWDQAHAESDTRVICPSCRQVCPLPRGLETQRRSA